MRLDVLLNLNSNLSLSTHWVPLSVKPSIIPPDMFTLFGPAGRRSTEADEKALSPTNPFSAEGASTEFLLVHSAIDLKSHLSQHGFFFQGCKQVLATIRNSRLNAKICDTDHMEVAILSIQKRLIHPGEDVVGTLDFRHQTGSKCYQFSVSLVISETYFEEGKTPQKHDVSASIWRDVVVGSEMAGFRLPVPSHIAPSFKSKIGCIDWWLEFKFGLMPSSASDMQLINEDSWRGPTKVSLKVLKWNVPIAIYSKI